jgi:hypothetical protein
LLFLLKYNNIIKDEVKQMKKILATILMFGFVVPVFAKVQKLQANHKDTVDCSLKEKHYVVECTIDDNICEVNNKQDCSRFKYFCESVVEDFVSGFAGTVGTIAAFYVIITIISLVQMT